MQLDTWAISWSTNSTGKTTLQIGCQKHDLDLWLKSDPRWVAALDPKATEWWGKYKELVLLAVKTSPATPHSGE